MKQWLAHGWDMTLQHKYVGVLLFLYRLVWGFFLFRLVDSVVTPVLARYPDLHPNADAIPLFLIEAEFRLLRTDLLDPLLWLLAGLLLVRMILTPVFHAGVYYSFHHGSRTAGTQVIRGIREAWKPVILLYWIKNALTLAPAVWLLPLAQNRFFTSGSVSHWIQSLLPGFLVWIAWGFILHLLFLSMQFGAVSGEGIHKGASRALARSMPLMAVSLAMAGIGFASAAAVSFVPVFWSGFAAVVVHQAFHFVRSLLSLWTAASQYAVWRT